VLRLRDRDVVLDARYAKSAKVNDPEIQQMTAKFLPVDGQCAGIGAYADTGGILLFNQGVQQ